MCLVCSFLTIKSKFLLCFGLLVVFLNSKKENFVFIPIAFASNRYAFCDEVVNYI